MDRLDEILLEVEQLPKLTQHGLFDPTNYREQMLAFFQVLKEDCQKSPEIRKRLATDKLQGSAEEIYLRVNASKHPVRNAMILFGMNLLIETEAPKTPEERLHQWRLAELHKVRRQPFIHGTPTAWIDANLRGCHNGHLSSKIRKDAFEPKCPKCQAGFPIIPPISQAEFQIILKES